MKNTFFLLLFLCGFMASCDKDDPQPKYPESIQTGSNSFFCLINGKEFYPKSELFNPAVTNQYFQSAPNMRLYVEGRDPSSWLRIGINIDSLNHTGVYKINSAGSANSTVVLCDEHYTISNSYNKLIITKYDSINRIISGTFEF